MINLEVCTCQVSVGKKKKNMSKLGEQNTLEVQWDSGKAILCDGMHLANGKARQLAGVKRGQEIASSLT